MAHINKCLISHEIQINHRSRYQMNSPDLTNAEEKRTTANKNKVVFILDFLTGRFKIGSFFSIEMESLSPSMLEQFLH